MSAVDLGHRGVQMSPSPLLKGPHMEHPARGQEKWSSSRGTGSKMSVKLPLETCRAGYLVLMASDRSSSTRSSSEQFPEYPQSCSSHRGEVGRQNSHWKMKIMELCLWSYSKIFQKLYPKRQHQAVKFSDISGLSHSSEM